MKVLKAKVKVTHDNNATQYHYSKEWLDNKHLIPIILYPTTREDEFEENGEIFKTIYPCVPDDLDLGFPQATEDEVRAFSEKHAPVKEVVTDSDKILAVVAKLVRNEELTVEEANAIDPTNSESGIILSKNWVDVVKSEYDGRFKA